MAGVLRYLVLAVMLALSVGLARAEERVALVIGNSTYDHFGPSSTSVNDAEDVAAALEALGFVVVMGRDLRRVDFRQAVVAFESRLPGADVAVLYYSGHGFRADDINYMIPVDTSVRGKSDLVFDASPLADILAIMSRQAKRSIVLLDSFRGASLSDAGRDALAGFGPVSTSGQALVALAAERGQTTQSTGARNSPFAAALIKALGQPGAEIGAVMRQVADEVAGATGNRQTLSVRNSLGSEVVMNNAPRQTTSASNGASDPSSEQQAWNRIVESEDVDDFIEFLDRYPNGVFAATARAQIRRLRQSSASAPAPAPAPSPAPSTAPAPVSAPASPGSNSILGTPVPLNEPARVDPRQLAVGTQEELIRVGCLGGRADGDWGPMSRRALQSYGREKRVALLSDEPTPSLLDQLRGETQRVCPLVCGRGEVVSGDRCVAKTCARGQELNSRGTCVAVAPPPPKCGRGERLQGNRCVEIRRAEPAPKPVATPRPKPQVSDGCPRGAKRNPRNGHCYFTPFCSAANKGLPGTDVCE